jgi:DNA-binding NtrC family response regulator
MIKILLALKNPQNHINNLISQYEVDVLADNESLLNVLAGKNYDLILLEDKLSMMQTIKTCDPRVEVILFGHGEEEVLEAIRNGAYAYFLFPVDIEKLREAIDSMHDMVALRQENAKIETQLKTNYTFFEGLVGRNPRMIEIFNLLSRIAPYYRAVTITGETGTGKEIIARTLHSLSTASEKPFMVCDCGALVETLIESELFGHKKGSFTGAIADKKGLFEAAGEGTLFLDEIGELPLSSQSSLLRVLQTGEFRRVGDEGLLHAKCRIIAATNRDLQGEVKSRNFREDLYYRITPFTIHLPSLHQRQDDILLLARYFLERFTKGTGKKVLGISRPAQIILVSHEWPGNIRELENVIEQSAILTTESFVRICDLPEHLRQKSHEKYAATPSLDDSIRKHIEEAIIKCRGNKSSASKLLGISRRSLLRKIDKYAINLPSAHISVNNAHPGL